MAKKEKRETIQKVLSEHGATDRYNWVSDFVYGGIDGAVTTFAVVAGVQGASLSVPIILILGFANLFADGFSMSVSKYSSDKAELEQFEKIRQEEYKHIIEKPEHERKEVEEIFERYGFKGSDLACATSAITANPDAWVDLMMRNEFNMTLENVNPVKGGVATFLSFLLVGFIPLMSYVFKPYFGWDANMAFIWAVILTLFALFLVGTVKSRFTSGFWLWAGLETAFIGGFAASIAYLVGFLLKGVML